MIESGYIHHINLVPPNQSAGFIEIPVEKIVDGEVVTVDTKTIPIISQKEPLE